MRYPHGWRSCGGSYGANLAARQRASQGGGGPDDPDEDLRPDDPDEDLRPDDSDEYPRVCRRAWWEQVDSDEDLKSDEDVGPILNFICMVVAGIILFFVWMVKLFLALFFALYVISIIRYLIKSML